MGEPQSKWYLNLEHKIVNQQNILEKEMNNYYFYSKSSGLLYNCHQFHIAQDH